MHQDNLYIALIHYPVMNKKGQTIGSAITNIDLHDIARASITFGVKGFYVVTPFEDQADLAGQIIEHWTKGVGGRLNPDRKNALELIRVKESYDQAVAEIASERGENVVSIATSAKKTADTITTTQLKVKLTDSASHMLVFGTAWGLTQDMIASCDYFLEPILGHSDYNHLSVRSAVSIYLDRIVNSRS